MRTNGYATNYTRTGKIDMLNKKPFRTAAQKAEARRTARLVDGRYVSGAPVSYHRAAARPQA
ncbi:hypothetical protein ACU8NH_09040 [Rhizobium leguminosarum]